MSQRYEITVAVELCPLLLAAMPGFEPVDAPVGCARLVGRLEDQAALNGLLHRLVDLRVELLDVHRLEG